MFSRKKFRFQNFFWSKTILDPKQFWVQKNFGPKKIVGSKNLSLKNILSPKFLVPPPSSLRHRVKYGGLNRSTGVGMGVPFLGFRVAYIPNLSLLQSLEPFEKESKI